MISYQMICVRHEEAILQVSLASVMSSATSKSVSSPTGQSGRRAVDVVEAFELDIGPWKVCAQLTSATVVQRLGQPGGGWSGRNFPVFSGFSRTYQECIFLWTLY